MAVEMKVDHLSRREQYMLSLVYTSISAMADKDFAAQTVNQIVAYADELEPAIDEAMLGRAIDAYNAEYRGTQAAWMKSALTAALKENNNG